MLLDELTIEMVEEDVLDVNLEHEIVEVEIPTGNYEDLSNKPKINDVELIGNVSLDNLDVQPKGNYPDEALTNNDIEDLINNFV